MDISADRRIARTDDKHRKATGNRRDVVIGVEHTRVSLCFEMYSRDRDGTAVVVWRETRVEIYSRELVLPCNLH